MVTEKNMGEQTLEISSPILTNGLSCIKTASNDDINPSWRDKVSEALVKASDALETRGRVSFFANFWACSTASPATADIESSVTRTYSRAGLGFPFLSTKDRTTSNSLSAWASKHKLDVICLHSVATVEVQANALAQCQSCQGSCPWACYRAVRRWWFLMSDRWRVYEARWVRH